MPAKKKTVSRSGKSKSAIPAGRDKAGKFQPGVSGNPSGNSRTRSERLAKFRKMLDIRCRYMKDGVECDLLVDAVMDGVMDGNPQLIKTACEYRLGKPDQNITVEQLSPEEWLMKLK